MNAVAGRPPRDLLALVAREGALPVSSPMAGFSAPLREQFGGSLAAVILYGSCLRDVRPEQGIVDICVLVTDYRAAYPLRRMRLLNRLLPPSVYYLEVAGQAGPLRAKYAVLSLEDFAEGTARWFHPYLWARFAQPVRLAYAATDEIRAAVHRDLANAVLCFLANTAAALPSVALTAEELWTAGLELTYAAELRPERDGQAGKLVMHHPGYYREAVRCALPALRDVLEAAGDGRVRPTHAARAVASARRRWACRRLQGRVLSVLRLIKAAFTFSDALEYAAWKVERHAGVRIEITPALRRHPILAGGRLLWVLIRRGALR